MNGSPHKKGCTYTALEEVARTLENEGVGTEIFHIGTHPIGMCVGCWQCAKLGRCAQGGDPVNECLDNIAGFDGFVFGSPVHYAQANGALSAFMSRLFMADRCRGTNGFYLKPAAAVVSARRAGCSTTFDQINKFFTMNEMPVISSQYWNEVHGNTPDEVRQDVEGMQTMRTLARNMAFFLKCKAVATGQGVPLPEREEITYTNFIR